MSLTPYLPTFDHLDTAIPSNLDVPAVANTWLAKFASAVHSKDASAILDTVHPDGWWRDIFALTWDLRCFHGQDKIKTFLEERVIGMDDEVQFKVDTDKGVLETSLVEQYKDMRWVCVQFHFTTRVAQGHAIAYLIPSAQTWKAFVLATHLSSLTAHPGPIRSFAPNHGKWEPERLRTKSFVDADPEVIIVGAGHSGLGLAARLGVLGVRTLVVDKNERVGDNWRWRYEALCLHDLICECFRPLHDIHTNACSAGANRLPYIEYVTTLPLFIPTCSLLMSYCSASPKPGLYTFLPRKWLPGSNSTPTPWSSMCGRPPLSRTLCRIRIPESGASQ